MIVEPERLLADMAGAGADLLLVQSEPASTIHLHRVLARIQLSKKAGVVLGPASPIAFVAEVLHLCDIVLVIVFLVFGAGKRASVARWCAGEAIAASFIVPRAGVDVFLSAELLA